MNRQFYCWVKKNIGVATVIALLSSCSATAAANCVDVDNYLAGTPYVLGEPVRHRGIKFECKVDGWCSDGAATAVLQYEPGRGLNWEQAWSILGACTVAGNTSTSSGSTQSNSSGAAVSASVYQGPGENFVMQPFSSTPSSNPLVMLAMSVDHELFKKAYNDYSDLSGGNFDETDTSYRNDFDYYGYFDSDLCYSYIFSNSRFESGAHASEHRCSAATGVTASAYTLADGWSGNFLNWASMARIDIIRAVLYGGKRIVDSSSETVLERANLPDDVHAFVKVYSGTDLGDFTPYAYNASNLNSLSLCNVTLDSTSIPLVRVGVGSFRNWSVTNGSAQCNSNSAPAAVYNMAARVSVCDSTFDGPKQGNCRQYPNGNFKPTGLLQNYGEDGSIRFGLLTGSYGKNLAGGVLRKDIKKFAKNNDASEDEVDLDTGVFVSAVNGIVSNIDAIRFAHWDGSIHTDCNTHSISLAQIKSPSASTRCSSWGNPISEIYAEALRYFSGTGSATTDFVPAAADEPSGLDILSAWEDPLQADEWCANCSIILLSTGTNSFDGDDLDTPVGDLYKLSRATLDSKFTDKLGDLEQGGAFSGTYFVGGNGSLEDASCTAKAVSELSDVEGVCADSPALEGTYSVAGLAYYAKTQDIRENIPGVQNVSTYTVDLAESIPSFNISVSTEGVSGVKQVTYLPSCQSNKYNTSNSGYATGWQPCSVFDVQVEFVEYSAGLPVSGSYLFFWEDSLWGNDYDLDMTTRVRYCVGAACNGDTRFNCPLLQDGSTLRASGCSNNTVNSDEIKIISTVAHADAGNHLRFGYNISGTQSGNGPSDWSDRPGKSSDNNFDFVELASENSAPDTVEASGLVYKASSFPSSMLLQKPLYYAAKYGNFEDYDGSGSPSYEGSTTDPTEWDREDSDGNYGADGVPDNYFQVSNPARLEKSLGQVFASIKNRVASGASASIITNSSAGNGMVYNAIYYPTVEEDGRRVNWAGHLFAFFKDEYGNLREDKGGVNDVANGILEDCSIDPIVIIYYDTSTSPAKTKLRRYNAAAGNCNSTSWTLATVPAFTVHGLEEFSSVWDARNQLALVGDATTQRSYSTAVTAGTASRHILTSMTAGSTAELIPFTVDELGMGPIGNGLSGSKLNNYRYLDVPASEANKLINFIRGDETTPEYRNRSVNFDGVSGAEKWLLGDIVNSTPAAVVPPKETYDSLHGDSTYAEFKYHYQHRRQVVYVGANDGMLHAFNSGFWNENSNSVAVSKNGEVAHALGAELWAYVPMNLLPHLQWLALPEYAHVYYVDGEPRSYDVNIFDSGVDANGINHINGWGTILVVGMRFGGGKIEVDSDGNGSVDKVLRSAYMVFDITDPEQPPVLLGEFSRDNLGFTSSTPALVKKRQPSASGDWSRPVFNSWKLVLGSGSDADQLSSIQSSQNARLFEIDLRDLVTTPAAVLTEPVVANTAGIDLGVATSFTGDLLSVDWNGDLLDDAAYFGIVGGDELAPTGRMMRRHYTGTYSGSQSTLLNTTQAFVTAPLSLIDGDNRRWLFFGSGRLFSREDLSSHVQQTFYGVKELGLSYENLSNNTYAPSSLIDTTDIRVHHTTDVRNATIDGSAITVFDELEEVMKLKHGWRFNFEFDGSTPSTRNLFQATQFVATILFPVYTPPNGGSCEIGTSDVYQFYTKTGTAPAFDSAYVNQQSTDGKTFTNDGIVSKVNLLNHAGILETLDNRTHSEGRITSKTSTGEWIVDDVLALSEKLNSLLDGRNSWRQIFDWEA